RGAESGGDLLALEILHVVDVVVIDAHRDAQTGLVVRAREVDDLGAFVGDRHPGDGDIEGSGLQAGDHSVEVRRLQVNLETDLIGDAVDDVDVETHVLAVFFELERYEGVVRHDDVGVIDLAGCCIAPALAVTASVRATVIVATPTAFVRASFIAATATAGGER